MTENQKIFRQRLTESQKVKNIMKNLKVSEPEALAIAKADKEIDQGADPFPLTAEQKKNSKKYTQADRVKVDKSPTIYQFDTSEKKRKENPTKSAIISELANFLSSNSENNCQGVEVTNKERQITFKIGDNDYELTLVQKRKPKK